MGNRPRTYAARKWHDGPGGQSSCKSCGEPIRWLLTPKGKLMPTDAAGVGPDETHFDHTRHRSHFESCRQQDLWRKPWLPKQSPGGAGASGI